MIALENITKLVGYVFHLITSDNLRPNPGFDKYRKRAKLIHFPLIMNYS
jgi:hypothetical protein